VVEVLDDLAIDDACHVDPVDVDAPPGRLYAIESARVGAGQSEPTQRAISLGQHELEVLVKVGKGHPWRTRASARRKRVLS
jgi:hypothetical protein